MNARALLHTPGASAQPGASVTVSSRTGTSGASTVRADAASVVNGLPQVVELGPSKSVLAG